MTTIPGAALFSSAIDANTRNLFMQFPAMVAILEGSDLRFTFANQLFSKLYEGRELVGRLVKEAVPELEGQGYFENLEKVYRTGEPFYGYALPALADWNTEGKPFTRYFDFVYSPYRIEEQIIGVIAFGIEVTQQVIARKLAEESEALLQKTKQDLELSINAGSIGIWHWDAKQNHLRWSKEQEEIYGLQEGAFSCKVEDFEKFIHPDDCAIIEKNSDLNPDKTNDKTYEFRIIRKDGSIRWIHARSRAVFDDSRQLQYVTGINIDITEERELQTQLELNKKELTDLANAMPQLVWVVDNETNVLYYNNRIEEYEGATQLPEGTWRWEGMCHPDDVESTLLAWNSAKQNAGVYEAEHRVRMKDGNYRWHLSRAYPQVENGSIVKWIGTSTDIHEQKLAANEIKESEKKFRSLAQHLPDIITKHDRSFRYTYVSPQVEQFVPIKAEEFLGKSYRDFGWPEEVCVFFDEELTKVFATKSMRQVEYFMPIGERYIYSRLVPEFDDSGEVNEVLVINTDITERKQSEETLREQQRFTQNILEASPTLTYIYDLVNDGNAFSSPQVKEMLGYTEEEVKALGSNFLPSVIHPDDAAAIQQNLGGLLNDKDNKTYTVEYRIKHKQGHLVWLYDRSRVFKRNDEGTPVQLLGVATDITERKQAEEAVRENEEQFRTLAETLPQLIWIMDAEGRPLYHSRKWEEYLGFAGSKDAWEKMAHPDDRENNLQLWIEHMSKGTPFRTEVRIRSKEGAYRWHASVAEPLKDASGKVVKWIGALTDIHDQKTISERLEALVKERTAQIEQLAETLTKANADLQKSNEDLQQFAHVASHDLKEPVRKIKMFSNRINAEVSQLPKPVREYVQKIERSTERLSALIDGILKYSSVDSLKGGFTPVNLNDILKNVEQDLEVLIAEKGAVIQYEELPVLHGNPILLNQLFYNLVYNALKFSRSGVPPRIHINAQMQNGLTESNNRKTGYLQISVADNGIGFDQPQSEIIFKTFTRLHTKDDYEGTGLGLALCKKIVERHGGSISAEGKVGEGAVFTIMLPQPVVD